MSFPSFELWFDESSPFSTMGGRLREDNTIDSSKF
jgi:hypothetical protein